MICWLQEPFDRLAQIGAAANVSARDVLSGLRWVEERTVGVRAIDAAGKRLTSAGDGSLDVMGFGDFFSD